MSAGRVTRFAVQTLLHDGFVHTGREFTTQLGAEESAARLVRLNGALCWIVVREERTTVTGWKAAS